MGFDEIFYREEFTDRQLSELRGFEKAAAARGIRCKIDPGTRGGIALIRTGSVAGYMTVDHFGGEELESAAIAGSAGDWDAMAGLLIEHARSLPAKAILFIADPGDRLVTERLEALGLAPEFSEYRMTLDIAAFLPRDSAGVTLRPASEADRAYIVALDTDDEGNERGLTDGELLQTQIIMTDGRPAGKLRTETSGGTAGIYGFAVDAALRNRGIGARALSLSLDALIRSGASGIYLEVDSENAPALHLYKKLGFAIMSEFRYYRYRVT